MSDGQGSAFGRIPGGTVELMQRTVQQVRQGVLIGLPATAGAAVRAFTVEQVLKVVLQDWSANGNTSGLIDSDLADLRSFVALAASLAGGDLNGEGLPVYQATLAGLLADWLENWNTEGDPGPPGPVD